PRQIPSKSNHLSKTLTTDNNGLRIPEKISNKLHEKRFEAQEQVLAGMNWAIANKCAVISMSLTAQIPVQPSYTAAGTAADEDGYSNSTVLNSAGRMISSTSQSSEKSSTVCLMRGGCGQAGPSRIVT